MARFRDKFQAIVDAATDRIVESEEGDVVEDALRVINRVRLATSGPHVTPVADAAHLAEGVADLEMASRPVLEEELGVVLEKVLGLNEMVGSDFLIRGAKLTQAAGRVSIREDGRTVGYGTGWMCGPDLLITNNHVLEDEQAAADSVVAFNYLELGGLLQTPWAVQLRPDRFFLTDEELDYTIVATDMVVRYWLPLIPESGKLLIGESANIIHHPSGGPQRVSLRGNALVSVRGPFRHYASDTEGGSSGAAVCNDQWSPAALHHAGVPDTDKAGNILLLDGGVWDGSQATVSKIRWIHNEGIAVSAIAWSALYDKGLTVSQRAYFGKALTGPRWP
jgi:endonuclease G